MGKDIDHRFDRKVRSRNVKSSNNYMKILHDLYEYLSRRTQSKFNATVLKRLRMSRVNRPPVSLSRILKVMRRNKIQLDPKTSQTALKAGFIAVIVATVTDDNRVYEIPKGLKICALHVTTAARKRVVDQGGEILTFDELAVMCPKGEKTIFISGRRSAREANKHFGKAPGVPGSHTKPFVRSKGRNFERARGRRHGCGYKN